MFRKQKLGKSSTPNITHRWFDVGAFKTAYLFCQTIFFILGKTREEKMITFPLCVRRKLIRHVCPVPAAAASSSGSAQAPLAQDSTRSAAGCYCEVMASPLHCPYQLKAGILLTRKGQEVLLTGTAASQLPEVRLLDGESFRAALERWRKVQLVGILVPGGYSLIYFLRDVPPDSVSFSGSAFFNKLYNVTLSYLNRVELSPKFSPLFLPLNRHVIFNDSLRLHWETGKQNLFALVFWIGSTITALSLRQGSN